MARLYANENFPFPVVEQLRHFGYDVLTIAETGRANQQMSDDEVLAFATADDRAVLTLNRKHFFRLHRERPVHAGIIACTYDPDFLALAGRIHSGLATMSELTGVLLRVTRPAS